MGADRAKDVHRIGPIEHELTMHLERAHELAERAQQSNDAVQHDIDRALEIAGELRDRVTLYKPG